MLPANRSTRGQGMSMELTGTGGLIDLNDLLGKAGIDPEATLVMRHRPAEKTLREVLPWLAADRHDLYNAYQSQHGPRVEAALQRATYLVSLIGHEAGAALFVGIYRVAGAQVVSREALEATPHMQELFALGCAVPGRESLARFDLQLEPVLAAWKGRLVLTWPGIERSWWRWADRNVIPVRAIHEESMLVRKVPDWQQLVLRWEELAVLPTSWKAALCQWRGIYYIFDRQSGKGYVGSAYGADNILGRWQGYAKDGHGGNKLLRGCRKENLEFSILQRVGPDMPVAEVIEIEGHWKQRLHTRAPYGLNDN